MNTTLNPLNNPLINRPSGPGRLLLIPLVVGLTACATSRDAAPPVPVAANPTVIVMPDQIAWQPVGNAGMMVAVVHGDASVAGPYTMLMKIPAGIKIPPHSHPDRWRTSVVVSGTLYFAFGNTWDEAALKPFKPGTVWTEPAGGEPFHLGQGRRGHRQAHSHGAVRQHARRTREVATGDHFWRVAS